jgi:hypothetical protein
VSSHPGEKGLANLWSRRRITTEAHSGRGQEIKWEMSIKRFEFRFGWAADKIQDK